MIKIKSPKLLFILVLVSAQVQAEIYREVSPEGYVVFTDRPSREYTPPQSQAAPKPIVARKQNKWISPNKREKIVARQDMLHNLTSHFDDAIFDNWLSSSWDCSYHFQRIDLAHNKYLQFFSPTAPLVIPIIKRNNKDLELFYSSKIKYQYDTEQKVLLSHRNNSEPEVLYICDEHDVLQQFRDNYDIYLINQQFLAGHSTGDSVVIKDGARFLEQECRRAYQDKEYKNARSTCGLAAANRKNIVAHYYLGMLYRYNRGGEIDNKKAYYHTSQAADAGFSPAYGWIAWHYRFSKGIKQDLSKALMWSIRAVDAGNMDSAISVANAYMQGKGTEQDIAQAAVWYLIAARAGDDHAQNRLGCMYANGVGVKQNYKLAHEWILKSHNKNNPKGTFNLAILYKYDKIVKNGASYSIPLFASVKKLGLVHSTDIIDKHDRIWLDTAATSKN